MSKLTTTLLGLPILAFALSAPLHAQGLGAPSEATTGAPASTVTPADRAQMKADKAQARADRAAARKQARADKMAMAPKHDMSEHSGGVGTGAGSTTELGGSVPGGGINGSGSGSGKP